MQTEENWDFVTLYDGKDDASSLSRGITIEEGMHDYKYSRRSSRNSSTSLSRKSLSNYSDADIRCYDYNDDFPTHKTKSGSMSSLSSRGSTLSWFRKRSRTREKGIAKYFNID